MAEQPIAGAGGGDAGKTPIGDHAKGAGAVAPAAPGAAGGDAGGGGGGGWMDGLTADVRNALAPKKYGSVDDLGRAYLSAEKLIGADKLALPAKDAKDQDWEKWDGWAKLGRPDKPEGYQFKAAEGVKVDQELDGWYRGLAHKHGLSERQAAAMYHEWNQLVVTKTGGIADAAEQRAGDGARDLKKEFGAAYPAKVEAANRAFREAFGDQAKTMAALPMADGTLLGNHPALVRAFARFGEMLSEDGELPGGRSERMSLTPDEAKKEIAGIRADAKHPFHERMHPEHQAAIERMDRLYALAYADERPRE
jgi:hypothetical protein